MSPPEAGSIRILQDVDFTPRNQKSLRVFTRVWPFYLHFKLLLQVMNLR